MEDLDEMLKMLTMLYMLWKTYEMYKVYKKKTNRRWVRKVNTTRDIDGYFIATFKKIKECDPEQFFKHTRMNLPLYNILLSLLNDKLTKNSKRKPIEAECRLALTLSYLSQGVSQQYLAWSHKMGRSTIHNIVEETCDIIWKTLRDFYVSEPKMTDYEVISQDFETLWDLPNCVGPIDGKHINIQCPPHSGSMYYNYKSDFNLVLMAACDARYAFTAIDIGAYGSQSDGVILSNSTFGRKLYAGELPLPDERYLAKKKIKIPYYFIGDAAFPLKKNIMKAYPGKNLNLDKRIFNYRISRARVVIENSFGILVARWRVLRNTLNCSPQKAEKIVLATIALHNFIILNKNCTHVYCPEHFVDWEDEHGEMHPGDWRKECGENSAITNISNNKNKKIGSNNATQSAFDLRDELKNYFLNEGAIEKQKKIHL